MEENIYFKRSVTSLLRQFVEEMFFIWRHGPSESETHCCLADPLFALQLPRVPSRERTNTRLNSILLVAPGYEDVEICLVRSPCLVPRPVQATKRSKVGG